MVVYCGNDCVQCAAYSATRAGDDARLEALALEWFGEADAGITRCAGCTANNGSPQCRWCAECPVRACARAMAIPNCAHCIEFETCPTLKQMFAANPQAEPCLAAIRASLG